MKLTASTAREFIDELPDGGYSNTSVSASEYEFEDAGDDPATFSLLLTGSKISSELQLAESIDVLI